MTLILTQDNSQRKLDTFQGTGRNVASYLLQIRENITAGEATNANLVLSAMDAAVAFSDMIARADADVVSAYRRETGKTGPQVQADASATKTAVDAVVVAMVAAYPRDAQNHPLDRVMDAAGRVTPVALSASSLSAVGAAIDGWTATIT